MRRTISLATAALLAMLVLAPLALAQETTKATEEPTAMTEDTGTMGSTPGTEDTGVPGAGARGRQLPLSGGPAILLPAAALLVGSGILTYAVLRRK